MRLCWWTLGEHGKVLDIFITQQFVEIKLSDDEKELLPTEPSQFILQALHDANHELYKLGAFQVPKVWRRVFCNFLHSLS